MFKGREGKSADIWEAFVHFTTWCLCRLNLGTVPADPLVNADQTWHGGVSHCSSISTLIHGAMHEHYCGYAIMVLLFSDVFAMTVIRCKLADHQRNTQAVYRY